MNNHAFYNVSNGVSNDSNKNVKNGFPSSWVLWPEKWSLKMSSWFLQRFNESKANIKVADYWCLAQMQTRHCSPICICGRKHKYKFWHLAFRLWTVYSLPPQNYLPRVLHTSCTTLLNGVWFATLGCWGFHSGSFGHCSVASEYVETLSEVFLNSSNEEDRTHRPTVITVVSHGRC